MAGYFSIFLVVITLATGLIWLADAMLLAPKRKHKVALAERENGVSLDDDAAQKLAPQHSIVEFCVSVFPVFAFVLVLRSFLYEPFQIPSGSMMPTLLRGDFILVEKFAYGLKDPVWRNKLVDLGEPERGDVVVFKYPEDTTVDYIKRVIGLPGDRVIYRNKQLFIKPACDGQETCPGFSPVPLSNPQTGEFYQMNYPLERSTEQLGEVTHDILRNMVRAAREDAYFKQAGTQNDEWVVPEGQYFVMGDNRDNSLDGRYWGFVPEENLVGRAVAIWMSFGLDREENSVLPGFVPTDVRFSRIGGIE